MRSWYRLQLAAITAGMLFAWYTVITDFMRFYDFHGTLFKIRDCIIPNPVTTPCFWGALGFVLAFIWALHRLRKQDQQGSRPRQGFLALYLLGGTIFGWSNVGILIARFIASEGKPTVGCSGQLMTNPLTTPCAYGAELYFVSLVIASLIYLLMRTKKTV